MTKKWLILSAVTFSVGVGISLVLDRDIKRAALTGLITVPATAAGVSVIEHRRKLQLSDTVSKLQVRVEELEKQKVGLSQFLETLQTQTDELKKQEVSLGQAISKATAQKQQVETAVNVLQTEYSQLQTQIPAQQSQKKDLEQALAILEAQKQQLETEVNLLQTQLQKLSNQEAEFNQALVGISNEQRQVEANLGSYKTELSQLQVQVAAQQQQKAAIEQDLVELEARKHQLRVEIDRLQSLVQELQQQESILNQSVCALAAEKQQLETGYDSLRATLTQLQDQAVVQQRQNREQAELTVQKQQLEEESQRLQAQIRNLKQQEANLNQSLEAIATQKQQTQESLNLRRTQLSQLQNQVAAQETYKSELTQDLVALEQQKHQLETESFNLQVHIDALEQQSAQLGYFVTTITAQKQETQDSLNSLQTELSQLQTQVSLQNQHKEQLNQELAVLTLQKDQLAEELRQLQIQTSAITSRQPPVSDRSVQLPPAETVIGATDRTSSRQRPNRNVRRHRNSLDIDFLNSKYTKHLWEDQILPHWSHRDRPAGHRFLGSICIERTLSDQLLDIVGQNLKQLDKVTHTSLQDEFYELEQNWLKVLTVALSEYAYYYSSERFWQGFCERLDIDHHQGVEGALRRVVDEGIDLLGLVRARGGYKYVSTLWLQSGVPEQNLDHFAQLVQEIADEYGWWELAHTAAEELSQVLLSICEEKHPQWGTLINFLKASYGENEETEPISGHLVQGIAIVAQELERQKASPQALQDEHQREELLGSYYLPQNFFLRNWNALIQVLTPRTGSGQRREVISRGSKPLFMSLDIADSWNTQLILPEQVLWKPQWRNLRGTYCQIPEANWEDTIPTTGDLAVPELVIDVNQASENWNCGLLDHNRQPLLKWHYEGIISHLPCLVFDALTGNHLPLRLPNPTIIAVEEIICFTPKDIQPQFPNGIEVLDNCIPSSIRGWRGRQIRLTTPESSIVLPIPEVEQPQLINWKVAAAEQPVLRGLRLKGKKLVYLEAPTFWYPPLQKALTLNVLIENITERIIIARTIETLSPNKRWFAIPLNRWIPEPGCYEARFWFEQERWSYRFEVQSNYQFLGIPEANQLRIRSDSGFSEADLPIKHNAQEKFWSEVIKFEGLWPLEEIIFFLSNSNEKIPYQLSADASGTLVINLPVLHELLLESNWYALDYQRSGLEPQRLIEMEILAVTISWTWANQAIHLSGLQLGKLYSLSCWNLLLPDRKPLEIRLSLIEESAKDTIVPLNLPTGIYHLQLLSHQQLLENLGWWCGSGQYDLPEEASENQAMENYCYTLLGSNESKEDFIAAVKALSLDFEYQQIQSVISSLENHHYHFPDWLNPDSLLSKLKELLEFLRIPPVQVIDRPKITVIKHPEPSKTPAVLNTGSWHLVRNRTRKRELFLKCLRIYIEQNKIQSLILATEIPQDSVYEDIILLNLADFKAAQIHLQKIDYFQSIERKPLKPEQVSRMLGTK